MEQHLLQAKVELYVHLVWATMNRAERLKGDFERAIYRCVEDQARDLGCVVLAIGGRPDHVHMVLSIPPNYCVSRVMGFLKGKSAIQMFRKYAGLRKKYYGQHYWSRGYAVTTVGLDEEMIRKYVRWQEKKDREEDAAAQLQLQLE